MGEIYNLIKLSGARDLFDSQNSISRCVCVCVRRESDGERDYSAEGGIFRKRSKYPQEYIGKETRTINDL